MALHYDFVTKSAVLAADKRTAQDAEKSQGSYKYGPNAQDRNPSYLKVSLKNVSVDVTPFSARAQISLIDVVFFNHRSLISASSYDQTTWRVLTHVFCVMPESLLGSFHTMWPGIIVFV